MQTRALRIDALGRVSLDGLVEDDVTRVTVRRLDDGAVLLEPDVTSARLEQRFHSDQAAVKVARLAAQSSHAKKLTLTLHRTARDVDR